MQLPAVIASITRSRLAILAETQLPANNAPMAPSHHDQGQHAGLPELDCPLCPSIVHVGGAQLPWSIVFGYDC
jgi:hypothetical protein